MRYLLDSNVFIAWLGNADRRVINRMAAHYGAYQMSSVVLFELHYGAFKSNKIEQNLRRIDEIGLPVFEFDGCDAAAAGRVRADLRRRGMPIGPYDILIAGQALARDLTLVTANVREFSRVEGLRVEDWTVDR